MIPLSRPYLDGNEKRAINEVLDSGWLAQGPKNQEFERMFAEYISTKFAVSVNSCTSALFLAVRSLGISGEVIMPSFTFVATANAVMAAGAKPVFVDIEYDTCNIDPKDIEGKITKNTEAIMPVHYAGHPCDMNAITEIAECHGIFLIEDSAQCIGGEFEGKRTGSFGNAGCFSFFPTKNLTTGEGGMITTDDEKLVERIRALKAHGIAADTFEREKKERPWLRAATMAGYNMRMTDISAAMGIEQMKKLESMNRMRIEAASYLSKLLRSSGISLPVVRNGCKHVFQMYIIKLPEGCDRTKFMKGLKDAGIQASVHYDPPVHLQPFYRGLSGSLPVTEDICRRIVTLPMFPGIKREEIKKVADSVKGLLH